MSTRILVKNTAALRRTLTIVVSVFFLFLSAQFSIPWHPVPLTFQSTTVLFLAMILLPAEVISAVAVYIALGAAGLPMFEGFSGGLSILFGATGGYILGFFIAAAFCSFLRVRLKPTKFLAYFALGFIGLFIIFACGVFVLAQTVGWKSAYLFGVQPFFISESAKLLLLAAVLSVKNEA